MRCHEPNSASTFGGLVHAVLSRERAAAAAGVMDVGDASGGTGSRGGRVFPRAPAEDFAAGDVVLAYHGALLYEATILEVGAGCPAESYRVHYQGWPMSWDDTVPRDSVVVLNDDNLRLAHELLRSAKVRQERDRALREDDPPASPPRVAAAQDQHQLDHDHALDQQQHPEADQQHHQHQQHHRERDAGAEQPRPDARTDQPRPQEPQEPHRQNAAAMFQMPMPLKRRVVEDYEWIVKDCRLVPLPRTPTVLDVLESWQKDSAGHGETVDRSTREVVAALIEYFDALLPIMLLYRFERTQFESYFRTHSTSADGPPRPSKVYGTEHLLRLLLKVPNLLDLTDVDPHTLKLISQRINELMDYIRLNSRSLLLDSYESAPPEYMPFMA